MASAGCQRTAGHSDASVAPDSVVGVVSITGTGFEQRILVRSGDRVTFLSPSVSDSIALSGLGGLEVLVAGKREPNVFHVAGFRVVRLNGAPVTDGILKNDGGRLSLDTGNGAVPLGNPPSALHGMVGARIWISGPLDTGPNSFGVIRARR